MHMHHNDITGGLSAGTPQNAIFDPTRGRSAGTVANALHDPTDARPTPARPH
jgi:hypothetical protein